MLLLGIDCSHSSGSVCIQNSNSILFHKEWKQEKSHAELITQVLADAFRALQLTLKDFTLLTINEGPGSFTGLRIALNTIRTLAFTQEIPIYALNSMEITAHAVPATDKKLLIALNAHSEMCYLQEFEWEGHWKPYSNPVAMTVLDMKKKLSLNEYLCAGEGFEKYKDDFHLPDSNDSNQLYQLQPNAILLNDLLIKTLHLRKPSSWKDIQPLYVRLSAPEEKALEKINKP